MNEEKPRDLAAILEDLKNPDALVRKTAVEECRLIGESNESITRTLAEMAMADDNKDVADSARQARIVLPSKPSWRCIRNGTPKNFH